MFWVLWWFLFRFSVCKSNVFEMFFDSFITEIDSSFANFYFQFSRHYTFIFLYWHIYVFLDLSSVCSLSIFLYFAQVLDTALLYIILVKYYLVLLNDFLLKMHLYFFYFCSIWSTICEKCKKNRIYLNENSQHKVPCSIMWCILNYVSFHSCIVSFKFYKKMFVC